MVRVTIGSSRALIILVYGTDPNRGEPCVLDIVKVLPDSVPGSTTPIGNEKELDGPEEMKYQVWSSGLQAVGSAPAGSA